MYIIPEGPPIIIRYSVDNLNISTRNTADWSVPTVSYTSVKVSCVEAFKIGIQRDKPLKQNNIMLGKLETYMNMYSCRDFFDHLKVHCKSKSNVPVLQFPHITFRFSHYLALDVRQFQAETRLYCTSIGVGPICITVG